jgi:hypothetical protein
VARRRNAKSLFEVITESPRPPAGAPPRVAKPEGGRPGGRERPAPSGETSGSPEGMTIPVSQFGAVSIVVGVILLIVLAFLWGRAIGIRSARPKKPAALPIGPGLLSTDNAVADGKYAGMVPNNFQRKKNYSYVVIQSKVRTEEEALAIKKFLYDNEINATVNPDPEHPEDFFEVKDTRGWINIYAPEVKAELKRYKRRIEGLGQDYRALGRPYDFKGPWEETEK